MVMFHDSLKACVKALLNANIDVDDRIIIVRDATGRLTVCRVDVPQLNLVTVALQERLGKYAGSPPVLDGFLAERLLKDSRAKPVVTEVDGDDFNFLYLDRRLVGADWLVGPLSVSSPKTHRVVFASLKGGVGRTTALAVSAASFAKKGMRVLAIDLDLEAPGIGSMLLPMGSEVTGDRRPAFGAVDYLLEEGIGSVPDHCLIDFIGKSSFSEGFIDVLPAVGRTTDNNPAEFIPKLSRSITESIEDGKIVPLWQKIGNMIERFESFGSYDVVLIDARAGISEISAAPLLTLGADVLLFATDQEQTFLGYQYIISYISSQTDYSLPLDENDWRSRLTFVQSKAPPTERQRARFRERLYDLCAEWLYEPVEDGDYNFSYAPNELGIGIPHDATFIRYDTVYDAFDPTLNGDQLDDEVYRGPFGSFLERLDRIIGRKKAIEL